MKKILIVILLCSVSHCYSQLLYNNGATIYNGAGDTLYVGGTIQNSSGTISNNGILTTTGDFTTSSSGYAGTGTFQMNGSSLQNFSGATYYNILVSGSGEKRMSGGTYLKNSLIFTNGYINTMPTKDTIFMDSAATLSEASGEEVYGYMKYQKYLQKGTTYTFGNIGLNLDAIGTAPGYTTVVRATGDSAIQKYGIARSIKRYFDITPANNTGLNATLTYYYRDAELNGISETDLELFKSMNKGVQWTQKGYTSRVATLDYLTLTGQNDLSRWTAGSITTPLPVTYLDFKAKLKDPQDALLNWETASEIDNDHFDLERSTDGNSFTKIGEVKGNGTTNKVNDYQYIDAFGSLSSQVLYYRLRQVDFNGKFTYSEIRKLNLSGKQENEFKAWYNSMEDKAMALIYVSRSTTASLHMIDMQGKLLTEQSMILPEGESQLSISMIGLAKGIYMLSFQDDKGLIVNRIMKY